MPKNSQLSICQSYDQTKFHQVKGIDNAFDLKELCVVLQAKKYFT